MENLVKRLSFTAVGSPLDRGLSEISQDGEKVLNLKKTLSK